VSFKLVNGAEINAFLTRRNFSTKPGNPNLVNWPDDNGEWLAGVGANNTYRWSVAIQRGDSIICESDVRTMIWRLN
jgi:hypothetical protein